MTICCKRCGGIRIKASGENMAREHVECDKADALERIAKSLEVISAHVEQVGFK